MHRIVFAGLALGLFASLGGSAGAADLHPYRWHSRVWYGGDCCGRGVPYGPGVRVAEQVPYCGDCDNPIGWSSSRTVRLRYVGWPAWEYGVAGGCYWRELPLADGRGGWVWGVEKICY